MSPVEALIIGAVAGILCQEAVNFLRNVFNIDDTEDGFTVHGVGEIFGAVMIALLRQASWTAQLGGLIVVGVFTLDVTFILIKLVGLLFPLRVDAETESNGLDPVGAW